MGGHYQIKTPWRGNREDLPDNYQTVVKRLWSTERSINKRPEIASVTTVQILDYRSVVDFLPFMNEYRSLCRGQPIAPASKLINLVPFLDEDQIMRGSGQLQKAEHINYDTRWPVIFPRGHKLTNLVVRHFHESDDHRGGGNHLHTQLLANYCIPAMREIRALVQS